MAGTLLGPDQIRKINTMFPTLVAHIRELLAADHSAVALMRVHAQVESFDSDEMARIFRELSFINGKEKLALVRAAIYELMAKEPALFIQPESVVVTKGIAESVLVKPEPVSVVFKPRQFNLNVATSNADETAKTDTKPTPVVTSTHTSKAKQAIDEGNKRMTEQQEKLDAAVAALRADSAPKAIEIMDVPADANLQDLAAEPEVELPELKD